MKYKITPIKNDASFRKFYRIKTNGTCQILVFSSKEKFKNLIVYSAINNFLISKKILAPKILSHNLKKNIIIIEDFGDISFLKILKKKKSRIKVYKNLVDLLIKIQKIKPKPKIKTIDNKIYKFPKYSKLMLKKESNLFFDWYFPMIFKKNKYTREKFKIKYLLNNLYEKINLPNSKFVHRDYHVSNIMKVKNKLGVIDTQDAIIGNPAYDLVSLIEDVRIKTSQKLKNKVLEYYLKKNKNFFKNNKKIFLKDFNILSLQRLLKIIGIFSRLSQRDNKHKYASLLPYTWQLLTYRLREKEFEEIRKIIDKIIPKKLRKKSFF